MCSMVHTCVTSVPSEGVINQHACDSVGDTRVTVLALASHALACVTPNL